MCLISVCNLSLQHASKRLFDFEKNNILQSESPMLQGDYVEDAITTLSSGTLFGTLYTRVAACVKTIYFNFEKNTTLSSGTLSGTPHIEEEGVPSLSHLASTFILLCIVAAFYLCCLLGLELKIMAELLF